MEQHPLMLPLGNGQLSIPYVIKICNKRRTDYVVVRDIVYLVGREKTTTFHVCKQGQSSPLKPYVGGNNLGYYDEKYKSIFIRANQSIVFNPLYLAGVTNERYLLLTCEHPPIYITDTYWPVVTKFLDRILMPEYVAEIGQA